MSVTSGAPQGIGTNEVAPSLWAGWVGLSEGPEWGWKGRAGAVQGDAAVKSHSRSPPQYKAKL
jgi:hypothetical protein